MNEIHLINMVLLLEKRLEIEEEQRRRRGGIPVQDHLDEGNIWDRVLAIKFRKSTRSGQNRKSSSNCAPQKCCTEPVLSKRS